MSSFQAQFTNDNWHRECETLKKRNAIRARRWGMRVTVFNDPTPANNGDYVLTYNLSSVNRQTNANWLKVSDLGQTWGGGGGGANIYNIDGSLSEDRSLSGVGNSLYFNDLGYFKAYGNNGISLISGDFYGSDPYAQFEQTPIFIKNKVTDQAGSTSLYTQEIDSHTFEADNGVVNSSFSIQPSGHTFSGEFNVISLSTTVDDSITDFPVVSSFGKFYKRRMPWTPGNNRSIVIQPIKGAGTVTVTNGSNAVLGTGTNFTDATFTGMSYWQQLWVYDGANWWRGGSVSVSNATNLTSILWYSYSDAIGGYITNSGTTFPGVSGNYEYYLVKNFSDNYGVVFGNQSISSNFGFAFGGGVSSSGQNAVAMGNSVVASGTRSFALGYLAISSGNESFAGGRGIFSTGVDKRVRSSGNRAFNWSENTVAQTAGFGALGANGAILGGINHNIPSSSPRVVILGGSGINARTSDPDQVYVPSINISVVPINDNALDTVLMRDPTGLLKTRSAATIGGGITNGSAIDELPKTVDASGNLNTSGIQSSFAGDLILGLSSLAGNNRVISTQGTTYANLLFLPNDTNATVKISRESIGEQNPYLVLGTVNDDDLQSRSITTQSLTGVANVELKLLASSITFSNEKQSVDSSSFVAATGGLTFTSSSNTLAFKNDFGTITSTIGTGSNPDGYDLIVKGGKAHTSGNNNGGNLILQPGEKNGSGTKGIITLESDNSIIEAHSDDLRIFRGIYSDSYLAFQPNQMRVESDGSVSLFSIYANGNTLTNGVSLLMSAANTTGGLIAGDTTIKAGNATGVAGSAGSVYISAGQGTASSISGGVNIQTFGRLNIGGLPTSSAGLLAGDIWNNLGVLSIV